MTYVQIETFLAVATYANITSASNYLYVTQSTVSTRIQQLEAELDVQLFLRQKGQRVIELTEAGKAFIPIASRWASLWKDTQNLKQIEDIRSISIASVDAVNNYTFIEFFDNCLSRFPNIKLSIRTHHSNEIHELVESRIADIGYVFARSSYADIISRPVYRELMYLVCMKREEGEECVKCSDLRPENEIFLNWGPDYIQWHDRHWGGGHYHLLEVNTGSMIQRYLNVPGRWAIAPMSVISFAIKSNPALAYYTLDDAPPPRICYELTNRYPTISHQEPIIQLQNALHEYIAASENICSFEQWMLQS